MGGGMKAAQGGISFSRIPLGQKTRSPTPPPRPNSGHAASLRRSQSSAQPARASLERPAFPATPGERTKEQKGAKPGAAAGKESRSARPSQAEMPGGVLASALPRNATRSPLAEQAKPAASHSPRSRPLRPPETPLPPGGASQEPSPPTRYMLAAMAGPGRARGEGWADPPAATAAARRRLWMRWKMEAGGEETRRQGKGGEGAGWPN